MRKICIAAILLCVAGWALCFPAFAEEPAVTEQEILETGSGEEIEASESEIEATESEIESEISIDGNENDSGLLGSIYERGRRWAEENQAVFAGISTVLGVLFFCLSELVGRIKIKKPVITASNNAVEMYQKTEKTVNDALAGIETVQKTAEEHLRVVMNDRKAVLLMACVVARLLEESALPQRTRDEIHELMAEAKGLIAQNAETEEVSTDA